MGLTNYNRGSKVNWNVENKDFPYIKLSQLVAGLEYPFLGFYITKDRGYGEGAVLITDGYNVNVPSKYVAIFRSMLTDSEAVQQIQEGKGIFSYEPYTTKFGRESYVLTFDVIE